jgi:hypothetical protein
MPGGPIGIPRTANPTTGGFFFMAESTGSETARTVYECPSMPAVPAVMPLLRPQRYQVFAHEGAVERDAADREAENDALDIEAGAFISRLLRLQAQPPRRF